MKYLDNSVKFDVFQNFVRGAGGEFVDGLMFFGGEGGGGCLEWHDEENNTGWDQSHS